MGGGRRGGVLWALKAGRGSEGTLECPRDPLAAQRGQPLARVRALQSRRGGGGVPSRRRVLESGAAARGNIAGGLPAKRTLTWGPEVS